MIDEVRKFLVDNHRGVLVARKRDGSPQMTLVTTGIDGAGRVVISARKNTFKVRNIMRDPHVSILLMGAEFHGSHYYQVDGKAEVIGLPDSLELLVDAYCRRLGDQADSEETRRKITEEDRVIIRIDMETVGPQSRGQGNL